MSRKLRWTAVSAVAAFTLGAAAFAADPASSTGAPTGLHQRWTVEMKDAKGKGVGTVTVEQTPQGLLLRGDLTGLPPGDHAIHIHETGKCEAPFKTAGGHFNPTKKQHGAFDAHGMHGGDLPNINVPASGAVKFETIAAGLTLDAGPNSVLDADGSAIVLHAKADDYKSQPAGDAGDRVACGALTK